MVEPKELLAQATKLLRTASSEVDYRLIIERAYYSAYHTASLAEETLPIRSKAQPQKVGVHEALLQRLERPAEHLDFGLRTTSKYVGAQLRVFKAMRELATYELKESIGIHQAEAAILKAEDILAECARILQKTNTPIDRT